MTVAHNRTRELLSLTFAIVSNAIAIGIVITIAYWALLDVREPLDDTKVALLNTKGEFTTHFYPGEYMVIQREACVHDSGPALFTRTILAIDGVPDTYFASSSYSQLNAEGCRISYNEIQLPQYLKPGHYKYVATLKFENNPLTSVTQVLPIAYFDIDPRPPGVQPMTCAYPLPQPAPQKPPVQPISKEVLQLRGKPK